MQPRCQRTDACTPLFALSGGASSPSSSHRAASIPRSDPAGASSGSVGPITSARNLAHESSSGLKSTQNQVIEASLPARLSLALLQD